MTTTPQNTDTFSSNISSIAYYFTSRRDASSGRIEKAKSEYITVLRDYAEKDTTFKALCSKEYIADYYLSYHHLVQTVDGSLRNRLDSDTFKRFKELLHKLGCDYEQPTVLEVWETNDLTHKYKDSKEFEECTYLFIQIPKYINSLLYLSWIHGVLYAHSTNSSYDPKQVGIDAFVNFLFCKNGLREKFTNPEKDCLNTALIQIEQQLFSKKQKIIFYSNDLAQSFITKLLSKAFEDKKLEPNSVKPFLCANEGGINIIPAFTLDEAFTKKKEGV